MLFVANKRFMAKEKTAEKILRQMGEFVDKILDGEEEISLDTMMRGMPCAEQGKFFIKVMDLYMEYTMSKPKQDVNIGVEFDKIRIVGETPNYRQIEDSEEE